MSETKQPSLGYETSDVNLRKTLLVSSGVVVFLLVSILGLNEYFLLTAEKQIEEDFLKPISPILREVRAHEEEMLSQYRVIDAGKGVYAIPITRAMEIIANQTYQKKTEPPVNPRKTKRANK